MAQPNVETSALVAEVARVKGAAASVVAYVQGSNERLAAKIAEALAADDAADQGTIDAVNAVIAANTAELSAASDAIAAAINTNPA